MEESKPIIEQMNTDIPKEENIQNNSNSNKIIIENDINEFEKPEEPKPISQIQPQEQPQIQPELIQAQSLPNNDQNNNNIIIINNESINTNTNNNNINASNTNLSLITNTDPGYIASQSNIEPIPIQKKTKSLGKKIKREYICEVETCKRIFYDKSSFRKHILTHGEKLFICEICKKKFLDNSKLRRHSLVHSGEKPYACPMCPKRFSLDFNLRTHMRIHSGEKPYACVYPGCFKRFSQSSNLSAHEKTHELMKKEGEDINKPIFSENPLKYFLENPFSGMANLDNVKKINEIYDLMKKGIIAQMSMINLGNYQVSNRNHGEIPGMPVQKRTYIKKANKENHNNNNNILYENQNINTDNNPFIKSSSNKKQIFHINDKDNYEINSEYNNQFLQPYKPSSFKKKIFATVRDPNRLNNFFEIISEENSNSNVIDLSGKKKNGFINDEGNYENENDGENKEDKEIELDEDKQENKENIFNNEEKEIENKENIL